jgi:hypothetical protein
MNTNISRDQPQAHVYEIPFIQRNSQPESRWNSISNCFFTCSKSTQHEPCCCRSFATQYTAVRVILMQTPTCGECRLLAEMVQKPPGVTVATG